jgi:hypothetical protein
MALNDVCVAYFLTEPASRSSFNLFFSGGFSV